MKSKTSYVKQKEKKFNITFNFEVNAKDREEAESILKNIAEILAKEISYRDVWSFNYSITD